MHDRSKKDWTVSERDCNIFRRWMNGDSVRKIAMDEYVSTQRIYDIIKKVRLYRGDEVYKDPYDLRYLQAITPRTKKFLVKRGATNLKELQSWVKKNKLTDIPGVGEGIERKILLQLDSFMKEKKEEGYGE